jgi:hypothetical protein
MMAASAGSRNHYTVLGVARAADTEIVAAAYRVLVKRYHPDVTGLPKDEAAARFLALQEAYEVLSNPAQRAVYDALLGDPSARAEPQTSPGPIPEPPIQDPRSQKSQGQESQSHPQAPGNRERGAGAARWQAAVLFVTGGFALMAWPASPIGAVAFVVSIFAALWMLESRVAISAPPESKPAPNVTRPNVTKPNFTRPPPNRAAAVAQGAFATVMLAVWRFICVLFVIAAAGIAAEVLLGK